MIATTPDENLILRMAEGDGNAFRELYQQTSSAVYGFALSILRNKPDAEDVMHDTFIKTYTSAITYKPMGKPMAWILTIVRNLCYNKLRSGKVCSDISEYHNIAMPDESNDLIGKMLLEEVLNTLDFESRQVVILHALTGLKHREIADILDLPLGTILSRYNRAIRKMRKIVTEKGEEE